MAEQEPSIEAMTPGSANEKDEQEPAAVPAPSVSRNDEISSGEPTADQPGNVQPIGDQPIDDQPMDDQPIGDQPMGDQATSNQHNRDAPTGRVFIDKDMLFTEIEKYPDLYLKDFNEYVLRLEKKKQWEQICERLYPHANMLSSKKMKQLVKKIRKKWIMIRYSFFERRRVEKKIRERIYDHRNCCPGGELFAHAAGVVNYFQDREQCVNQRQFADGIAPILNVPPVADIPDVPEPIPSTSTPFDFSQPIPSTSADSVSPPSPIDKQLVTVIYEELLTLNTAQLNAIAPKILSHISDVKEKSKSKIKILQTELLGAEPLEIPIAVLETFKEQELQAKETFTEQEAVAQETLEVPETVSLETCAASEPVAEETLAKAEAGEDEEEGIYPSSYGRPKNDKGEIIYPETDPEDFD